MLSDGFKFVDLFSGIGGFHQALSQLGGKCVFASEIDKSCNETYLQNYGIRSDINICEVDEKSIPPHDVLCAGFPCQAFSKAGKQQGMKDSTRGTLFFEIERILRHHHSKFIILENVRNLVSHDNGNTWRVIKNHLIDLGYRLTPNPLIISPHQFGIPQIRERVVILGKFDPINNRIPLDINWAKLKSKEENDIYKFISKDRVDDIYYISDYEELVLNAWDEFYHGVDINTIGFPVWADYFNVEPIDSSLPNWKRNFIQKNQELYLRNRKFIDSWLSKYDGLKNFTPTCKKFEWQCGNTISTIWEALIQLRPSGIRVKTPNCFPALVAIVQIPIIGRYRRRLTVNEAAVLQSFPKGFKITENRLQAYKQFGNSVNVEVIKRSAEKLFNYHDSDSSYLPLELNGLSSEYEILKKSSMWLKVGFHMLL